MPFDPSAAERALSGRDGNRTRRTLVNDAEVADAADAIRYLHRARFLEGDALFTGGDRTASYDGRADTECGIGALKRRRAAAQKEDEKARRGFHPASVGEAQIPIGYKNGRWYGRLGLHAKAVTPGG